MLVSLLKYLPRHLPEGIRVFLRIAVAGLLEKEMQFRTVDFTGARKVVAKSHLKLVMSATEKRTVASSWLTCDWFFEGWKFKPALMKRA